MKGNKLSLVSKVLALLGFAALVASLFVPLWRIELDAPQYPEGLVLQIFPNKLGGNVEIINGLNHYIGMQTLHAENFIEFTVLPYIIGFYALLYLSVVIVGKRRWMNIVFFAFVLFGIIAMIDFWRWEYNYGHDLNPNAAIVVPGMAYQPPLIGFKQLLNFGAYSVPDIGGWLFIAAGFLLLVAVLAEAGFLRRLGIGKAAAMVGILATTTLLSCGSKGPESISFNSDKCAHCKMTISDSRFAAEMKTVKGRVYKFDDVACMISYIKENPSPAVQACWVCAYDGDHALVPAGNAVFVKLESLNTPMRGNMAAFASQAAASEMLKDESAAIVNWNDLVKEP